MNFERGKSIKESLDLGIRNYPHVVRAYRISSRFSNVPFPLDELIEFLKSGGKKYNSRSIRITTVSENDVEEIYRYWKSGGKLPKEDNFLYLEPLEGKKIVIRGKIYTVP